LVNPAASEEIYEQPNFRIALDTLSQRSTEIDYGAWVKVDGSNDERACLADLDIPYNRYV